MSFFSHLDVSNVADRITMLRMLRATEIVTAEQYYTHGVNVKGLSSASIQQVLFEHAQEELDHASQLMNFIHDLGGRLDNTLASTLELNQAITGDADVDQSTRMDEILKSDLRGENIAIAAYKEAAKLVRDIDPACYVMLASILRDEMEHAQELKNLIG